MWTINELREAVCRKLESLPELAGVPVIPEDRQNVVTEITKALSQAKGLCVVVNTGEGRCDAPGNPAATSELQLLVEIAEIPVINRSPAGLRLPAVDVMGIVVSTLHQHTDPTGGTLTFVDWSFMNDKVIKYTPAFSTRVMFKPLARKDHYNA